MELQRPCGPDDAADGGIRGCSTPTGAARGWTSGDDLSEGRRHSIEYQLYAGQPSALRDLTADSW